MVKGARLENVLLVIPWSPLNDMSRVLTPAGHTLSTVALQWDVINKTKEIEVTIIPGQMSSQVVVSKIQGCQVGKMTSAVLAHCVNIQVVSSQKQSPFINN